MNKERLYQAVGEALHLSQVLELNISLLISILNRQFQAGLDERQVIRG
jgi:hypothetical protein